MTMTDPLRSLRPVAEEALEALVEQRAIPSGNPLAYDVYASNHELVIEFDIPGVVAEQLGVEVYDRTLVVTATREPRTGGGVDVIETGRQHGTFTRRLFLGERWDVDQLTAEIEHGVLRISTPMAEVTHRQIDILPTSAVLSVAADVSVDSAA